MSCSPLPLGVRGRRQAEVEFFADGPSALSGSQRCAALTLGLGGIAPGFGRGRSVHVADVGPRDARDRRACSRGASRAGLVSGSPRGRRRSWRRNSDCRDCIESTDCRSGCIVCRNFAERCEALRGEAILRRRHRSHLEFRTAFSQVRCEAFPSRQSAVVVHGVRLQRKWRLSPKKAAAGA